MKAVKYFEIEEKEVDGAWYQIKVLFNKKIVDVFFQPTKEMALEDFHRAGYKMENQQ